MFGFLAGMTLACALGVVLSRNVVHSALFMSGSFLAVAGFFVVLGAPVLAAFQVLVYVGAVTVVILFGIMFTQKPQVRRFSTIMNRQVWAGLLVALGVGGLLSVVLVAEDWGNVAPGQGNRDVVAFSEGLLGVAPGAGIFVLLFEVAAVLLLVAMIAAIVISRRKPGEGEDLRPDREGPEGIGSARSGS
ncbi:NADH-quinone oxidoreductase subunit J [Rubrobacter radiotolerans]|uniref:NADH-quinone oxidoreductase subunit J n=1 Tax=Rubrobacter radiotolerans TaxID=42256 RepID=A0AB35T7B2_RUBRA|nr:NADH-quinone oxidoreductase subunit J [Rubrobacter radiotolerans]MDX5894258.1 NADH-quinone oxidoreductase subunit J [Rubrobacter radiotolerans]